jgi:hypothetical protein
MAFTFEVLEGATADITAATDTDAATTPSGNISRIKSDSMDFTSVAGHMGWLSTMFDTDELGGREDEIIVYSNAKEVPFGDPDSESPYDQGAVAEVMAVEDDPDTDADETVVGVPAKPNSHIAVTDGRFAEDTATGPEVTIMFDLTPVHDPDLVQIRMEFADGERAAGTFGGVMGYYTCESTAADDGCAITRERMPDGTVTFTPVSDTNADWWFRASGDDMVTNADYLIFGAWLHNAEAPGGARTVGAFADGGRPIVTFGTLEGTAKYMGPAAGHYAERRALNPTASSGRFTATANLTADFAAGGMVGGMVTDFRLDGVERDWLVELDAVATEEMDLDATTSGRAGSHNWTGQWAFQFYGATEMTPTGIAGTFSASSGNPHPLDAEGNVVTSSDIPLDDKGFVGVVGGFGATMMMPEMDDMEDDM